MWEGLVQLTLLAQLISVCPTLDVPCGVRREFS